MRVRSLFKEWTNFTREDMARALRKFRQGGCLYKHPTIKHCYQGLALFDRYDFDCRKKT